ncbi:MAG TPA: Rieske 2Fe-2S domain-containing protein [Candidatus Limnocylindrales bacterium]|nr:Rieske 2Fe-2S domain-containing protein [Candidatus Limnocylindrales bacterium]
MSSPVGRGPTVPAAALVPLRLFLGGTFVYAGFDKLLDPRFFDATSAASIQAQMLAFVRVSPIAPLVRLALPVAPEIGLLIALGELAIGLGALSGLAFRLAAWAGAALSLLFFLTASWATRPFYYGADLPFTAGWLTLALAGHGGVLVPRRLLEWSAGLARSEPAARGPRRAADRRGARGRFPESDPGVEALPVRDRRSVLQAAVLGALAVLAASFAIPFRPAGSGVRGDEGGGGEGGIGGGASPAASAAPGASPLGPSAAGSAATGASGGTGLVVASVADVAKTGARAFTVPFTAPAPLPAGDPGVIVRLANGSYVAFDAVCTHAGCEVQWDRQDRVLLCPCHGAAFDPAHQAAVLQGPTDQPLAAIPIAVDAGTGTISLVAR